MGGAPQVLDRNCVRALIDKVDRKRREGTGEKTALGRAFVRLSAPGVGTARRHHQERERGGRPVNPHPPLGWSG